MEQMFDIMDQLDPVYVCYSPMYCNRTCSTYQSDNLSKYLYTYMKVEFLRETQKKMIQRNLHEAQGFALSVLQKWNLGECTEDVIIFYSQDDNVVSTFKTFSHFSGWF